MNLLYRGQKGIYSSFSELIKLPTPSSWGIFEGDNKCFDQGTVLLQGEEDGAREIIPFCALVGSCGATEPTPWLPGVGIHFPTGFLFLLVSPVVTRTLPFARKITRTSSLDFY